MTQNGSVAVAARRFRRALFLVLVAGGAISGRAVAGPSNISIDPVKNSVNGVANTNIGAIGATLGDGTGGSVKDRMEARYTLPKNLAYLTDCVEFHWLQVVTQLVADPGNPTYKNAALKIPIIDTPNGGYDGQVGEDDKPWYLTAGEEATFNGTNPDGSKFFSTRDTPGVKGAFFHTWLAFVEKGTKDICLVAGFEWGSGTLGGTATLAPRNGADGKPNAGDLQTVTDALANGAFAGWTASINCNIVCVPAPGAAFLLSAGLLVAVRRRRA